MRKLRNTFQKGIIASGLALSFAAPVLARGYSSSSYSSSSGADAISLVVFCCICVFSLLYFGLKIYLTVDALKRDYGDDNSMKIIGILMLWILDWIIPFLGMIVYYFVIMRKYPKTS